MKVKPMATDCEFVFSQYPNKADRFEPLRNQTILITGASGFIGLWLLEFLTILNDTKKLNIKIFALSRRMSETLKMYPHLANRKDIQTIDHDVRSIIEIDKNITHIIHAAGNPDSRDHAKNTLSIVNDITEGISNILSISSRLPNIRKIINVSSGLVYGQQPTTLEHIPESYIGGPSCDSALSAYAEAKRYSEILGAVYRSQFKLPIVTVRPFTVSGPYQLLNKPWALNCFVRDALHGGPIRITGNENTVRSYMYGADAAYWILAILVEARPGNVFNLGSSQGITMRELASRIAERFTKNIEIVSDISASAWSFAGSGMPPSRLVPDISAGERMLGLRVTFDLNAVITKTTDWYIAQAEKQ